jgi:protein-tyrosine phosphatase
VQNRPDLLTPIVAGGTLVQLTAASIDGRMGSRARSCAATLLDRSLAHLVASDAHAPNLRSIGMSAAVEALADEALARWLTVSVPSAIVENEPMPARPRAARRRSFFRR